MWPSISKDFAYRVQPKQYDVKKLFNIDCQPDQPTRGVNWKHILKLHRHMALRVLLASSNCNKKFLWLKDTRKLQMHVGSAVEDSALGVQLTLAEYSSRRGCNATSFRCAWMKEDRLCTLSMHA